MQILKYERAKKVFLIISNKIIIFTKNLLIIRKKAKPGYFINFIDFK